MEKNEIALFISKTKEKLTPTSIPLDSLWRFKSLLEHTTRLKNSLSSRKLQRDNNLVSHLLNDYQDLSIQLYSTLTDLLLTLDTLSDAEKNSKAHGLVNKLSRELEYLDSLTTSVLQNDSYYSKDQPDEFSWFENVIQLAANDLDVDSDKLLVLFNLYQTIGLRSFVYTKEFYTLDLPVTMLGTPWEWSVVWHELAGIKVKDIRKRLPNIMKDTLKVVHNRVAVPSEWTEDYLEELFEDAGSVLVFGSELMDIFKAVLNRTYDQANIEDSRHPSKEIRENIANLLLGIQTPTATPDQKIVADVIKEQFSEYLPSQKGSFADDDPHKIILDAITAYKKSPANGDGIYANTKSRISDTSVKIPPVVRSTKQTELRLIEMPKDPDFIHLNVGGILVKLFSKFTTNENKVSRLINLRFSESDFMSPTDHSDDPAHPNASVTIRFSTSHGDHKLSHKKNNG